MRQTVAFLEREAGPAGFDPTLFTATTCDADSCFDRRYLEALGDRYLVHEHPAEVVWQPPLFYNYGLAEAAVFTYLGVDFILADWGDNGHFHWGFIGLCIAAMLLSRALNIFPIAFLLNKTVRRGRSIPPSEPSNVFCLTTFCCMYRR